MKLQYPNMRDELISYLKDLADANEQRRSWRGQEKLDYCVHFLFDDTDLADDVSATIGVFLFDESEAMAVSAVVHALDSVFDKYGTNLMDQEYVALPEWLVVISAAEKALALVAATRPA